MRSTGRTACVELVKRGLPRRLQGRAGPVLIALHEDMLQRRGLATAGRP